MVAALSTTDTCQISLFSPSLPTQRERDSETEDANGTGLMHYRARTLDPRTGRFIQRDPELRLRIQGHYAYAGLDPVSLVDPTGERPEDVRDFVSSLESAGLGWPGTRIAFAARSVNIAFQTSGTAPLYDRGSRTVQLGNRFKDPTTGKLKKLDDLGVSDAATAIHEYYHAYWDVALKGGATATSVQGVHTRRMLADGKDAYRGKAVNDADITQYQQERLGNYIEEHVSAFLLTRVSIQRTARFAPKRLTWKQITDNLQPLLNKNLGGARNVIGHKSINGGADILPDPHKIKVMPSEIEFANRYFLSTGADSPIFITSIIKSLGGRSVKPKGALVEHFQFP